MLIETKTVTWQLDERGNVTIGDRREADTALLNNQISSPLARIVVNRQLYDPEQMIEGTDSAVTLLFMDGQYRVNIQIRNKQSYVTYEVIAVPEQVETLIWGPIFSNLSESIGESVGVVHNEVQAIGLQCLNEKTIGGWPLELARLAEVAPVFAVGETTLADPNRKSMSDSRFEYEVCTAWPTTNDGSLLQAYARNRSKAAVRPAWHLEEVHAHAVTGEDGSIIGSKIALFACSKEAILDTIEAIEVEEDLPHPTFDGVWGKISPEAVKSYLITDFGENNFAAAVEYTKQAGFDYIYHPAPFANWGHFELDRQSFPAGDTSLANCTAYAADHQIKVGVHTLTNFTTWNDPYVTPIPDERLVTAGEGVLLENIDELAEEIVVSTKEPFILQLHRKFVKVDQELIEYTEVSETAPPRLLGVKRGALGTTVAAHQPGAIVSRMWDHPYQVFFPNIDLQADYSKRLATLFRTTGLKQISFDGLEGVFATGHDDYAANRFVAQCYHEWGEEVINDASIVVPNYAWHMFTRFNWGEPWGAATREGQMEWRLSNQRYFKRNFIPPMLGWFLIRLASQRFEATTPDELEWVLAKASGFQAGFAISANMSVLERHGNSARLLELVRQWEQARAAQVFSEEQRARLRDPALDWHLAVVGEKSWKLHELEMSKPLVCDPDEQQPGQPGGSDFSVYNRYDTQPLQFRMHITGTSGGSIAQPSLYANGVYLHFDVTLEFDQILALDNEHTAKVYDKNWNLLQEIQVTSTVPVLRHGHQPLSFSCQYVDSNKPLVSIKVFTYSEGEMVQA